MPYQNEYNEKIAKDIDSLNRKYLLNEQYTLDPKIMSEFHGSGKLSGGFLGALAGAVLPMVLGKLMGNGKEEESDKESEYESESDEEEDKGEEKKEGGAMYNSMRDKMEGMGKASKAYKHQSEEKYACGMGMAGGSAFGVGQGSIRDTGEGVTESKNMGLGKSGGKKRGRKSKMGAGLAGGKKRGRKSKIEGSGVVSDLGIPIISNIAGLFGLGHSGGSRSDPLRPEKFYPKVLDQTAPTANKSVPPAGIADRVQNLGSNMSGMGKRGRKKVSPKEGGKKLLGKTKVGGKKSAKALSPWLEVVAKVRKERPELRSVKAISEYIKKNNLYKKKE